MSICGSILSAALLIRLTSNPHHSKGPLVPALQALMTRQPLRNSSKQQDRQKLHTQKRCAQKSWRVKEIRGDLIEIRGK
jgi:hypothetical protein